MVQVTGSPAETLSFAERFARQLERGDVIALYGDLGTGKTQFVKGVCRYFGVNEHITSPTFVLLNRYRGKDSSGSELLLFHFDLYRIQSHSEVYDLGYEEFFYSQNICFVEWAERLGNVLPQHRYDVKLAFGTGENERSVEIVQKRREVADMASSKS